MTNTSTFEKQNVFSIRIKGNGAFVQQEVETLVKDFNEPKFGYMMENWDEEDYDLGDNE